MRIFLSKGNKVIEAHETDAIDIWSKRYTIKIRMNGITITRKARPKKGLPAEDRYDHNFNFE